jgi:hypothetical protein
LKRKELLILFLLTLAALAVHGYHPWSEDAEIYLPGVEKMLHPQLFPFNAQFFEAHAQSTFFPNLIAGSVRLTHWPLVIVLFCWQVLSIFLFLLACWQLIGKCFSNPRACWAGVGLVAALLTIPISGTALYILDPFVNPRNIVAFASILAIVKVLERKYAQAGGLLILTAAIHPLMSVFVVSYCGLLFAIEKFDHRLSKFALVLPFGLTFDPPPKAYHLVAEAHPFHYITRWEWYEWLGVVAPLIILWWFSRIARKRDLRNLDSMCRALVIYGLVFIPPAVVLSVFSRLEALARLAPMRSYWLLYVLMLLFGGGLLGEYVLKNRVWRWLVLFIPLCAGMFFAQRALYPGDAHVEWPGAPPKNHWVQAFDWVRDNTPPEAIFALDPDHMNLNGEGEQGFRAIAQRSRLADSVKDSGAVSMFPAMADEWYRQVQALSGWQHFQLRDFERLHSDYGVTWIVVQHPVADLNCPYQNATVEVCQL